MSDAKVGEKRKHQGDEKKQRLREEIVELLKNDKDDGGIPLGALDLMKQICEQGKTPNDMCTGCDTPIFAHARFMRTHKNGYERPFCQDCIKHCKCCQEDYVESLDWQHEDCASHCHRHREHASSESESDETKKEEQEDEEDDDDDDSIEIIPPTEKSLRISGGFQIWVKGLTNNTITLRVDNDDTIEQLKRWIQIKDGTIAEHQRLIFAGKQLEDHRTIGSYKFAELSTIHMVLRMRGC